MFCLALYIMYDLNFYNKLLYCQKVLNLLKQHNIDNKTSFTPTILLGDLQEKLNCEEKITDDWVFYLFQYKKYFV